MCINNHKRSLYTEVKLTAKFLFSYEQQQSTKRETTHTHMSRFESNKRKNEKKKDQKTAAEVISEKEWLEKHKGLLY